MKTKLYFAYGMNTNVEQMSVRCSAAIPMDKAILPDYRLEFKSYATIVPSPGDTIEGVLWTITPADEVSLDLLEGYPEFYSKKHVTVRQGIDYIAMTYIMMPREHGHAPSEGYYSMVSEGYQRFGLSQRQLLDAKSRVSKPQWFD